MEYCITSAHVMEATGAHENSICRWFKHTPRIRRKSTSRNYYHMYRPDDVVTTLRRNRRKGLAGAELARLVDMFPADDPAEPLGDDSGPRAAALIATFTGDEKERFAGVCKWAGQGAVSGHLLNQQHLDDHGRALALLVLRPAPLTYILTARRRDDFPTTRDGWGGFMAAHVHSVARPDEITRLVNKSTTYRAGER